MPMNVIGEFLAYVVVADKQIHSEEMRILEEFISHYDLDESAVASIHAILGDADHKRKASDVFRALRSCGADEKSLLLEYACAIACVDLHRDTSEDQLLLAMCKSIGISEDDLRSTLAAVMDLQIQKADERRTEARDFKAITHLTLKIRSYFASGQKKEELERKANRLVLTGPKYREAIILSHQVAVADCEFLEQRAAQIRKHTVDISRACDELLKTHDKNKEDSNEDAESLRASIDQFVAVVKIKADEGLQKIAGMINAKRRAKDSFSIAFIGRTKAGKSTLHYLMTGEGKGFIGKGLERTTRYNRVYEWDNLRIVDTPGIGAAEAGGRSDEEIAASIIDETDLICYVVTSDNIQQTEFNFLKAVRDRNKPVVVLLNNKSNISIPPAYKAFIADKLHWYTRQDELNIQGHINRINEYIGKYYRNSFITVIPVHLLAAKLANDFAHEKDRDTLLEGSRIDAFYDHIRDNVIGLSALRKSQTIVDGAAVFFHEMKHSIQIIRNDFKNGKKVISSKKISLSEKIESQRKSAQVSIITKLDALFDTFGGQAAEFAEDNYNRSSSYIESEWENYAKNVMRISENVNDATAQVVGRSVESIAEHVQDVLEDIGSFFDSGFRVRFDGAEGLGTRRIMSSVSALLSVAGSAALYFGTANFWNPVGWALIGLGIAGGLLSRLFSSKDEQKRKAIEKLRSELVKGLKQSHASAQESCKEQIDRAFAELARSIMGRLTQIEAGFSEAERISSQYLGYITTVENELNRYYAARIVEHVFGRTQPRPETDLIGSVGCHRELGKYIEIIHNVAPPDAAVMSAAAALQEELRFTISARREK